ncbi:MAG: hypothetical protein M3433_00005 [Actinomycetota bacterium]|nr:hypothetical protein [Actinomycetota bacterium]
MRNADQALTMVESLVSQNEDAQAAVQFARNRLQMRAAARETRRLQRRSSSASRARRAATATRLLARQSNSNAETFADIVDEVSGQLQLDVARAAASDLRARELALAVLTALIDRVPEQARPAIARAIAALSTDGQDEVANLAAALESGALPPEAEAAVQQALQMATAAIDQAIERLNGIVGLVPEEARPQVEQAVELVTQQLEMVKQLLAGLFSGGLPGADGPSTELPIPGGLPAGACIPFPLPFQFSIPGC